MLATSSPPTGQSAHGCRGPAHGDARPSLRGAPDQTTRAPGTGPCAVRTSRQTDGSSAAAICSACVGVGGEEDAGRPGAGDDAGERAGPLAGLEGLGQRRAHRRARRPAGRCRGRRRAPPGRAGAARPAARRSPASGAGGGAGRPAAGRARGTPAGVERPPSAIATTQCQEVGRASTGLTASPRPVPSAVPPCSRNGTSEPRSAAMPASSSRDSPVPQSSVAGDQGGGGVGAAAGQPAGERDLLAQVQPGVRGHPGVGGERPGGPDHQVGLVERQLAGALALHGQREGVAAPGGQLVVEGDRVVDGVQLVVAVAGAAGRPRGAD